MPKQFRRLELAITPGIMARITPPNRRITVTSSESGDVETLKFSFFDSRTCLTAVKCGRTGHILASIEEKPGLRPRQQLTEEFLLLNKHDRADNKGVSPADLVREALKTAGWEAQEAAKKTMPPGASEAAAVSAGIEAYRHAHNECKRHLGTRMQKEACDALKEFIGRDICRLAEAVWGKNATVKNANELRRAGAPAVAQAMKISPQLARLAMVSAGPWERETKPDELLEMGRRELLLAAEPLGPEETGEGLEQALNRIDKSIFTKHRYRREALTDTLELASGAQTPVPQFAVSCLIYDPEFPFIRHPLNGRIRENLRQIRLHLWRSAYLLYAQDPKVYNAHLMRRTVQDMTWRIQADGITSNTGVAILEYPNPERIAREVQAEADKTAAQGNPWPGRARSASPGATGDQEKRKTPRPPETGAERAAAWSAEELRGAAAKTGPAVEWTKSSATLKAGRNGPELYSVVRQENGAIGFSPGPLQGAAIAQDGTFRYGAGRLLPAMNAAALAAALWLDPGLPRDADHPETLSATAVVAAAAAALAADEGKEPELIQADQAAALKLTQAANRLLDPAVAERAAKITGRAGSEEAWITIPEYNAAALAGERLDNLAATNPGAAAWAIRGCPSRIREKINHPGQLVSIVKKDAAWEQPGTRRSVWKTLTATEPETLERLRSNKKGEAKTGYNRAITRMCAVAAARAGARSITQAMARILESLTEDDDNIQPEQDDTLLAYCFREPEKALRMDLLELRDYCRAWNPTATTLSGLKKAADRWHRQLRENGTGNSMDRRPILSWESAITEIELSGGIRATALTSTIMLAKEGAQMEHCVVTYDKECAKGRSRIFHLSSGATAQLSRQKGVWKPIQVRRKKNGRPEPAEEKAAQELAEKYATAWQESKIKAARKARIISA